MRPLSVVLWAAMSVCLLAGEQPADVGTHLQACSVTIKLSGSDAGSGTVVIRAIEGKDTAFVLTAAHVVDQFRKVKEIITPSGEAKKQIVYDDVMVLQEFREEGRTVGDTQWYAKIVNVDNRRDIALLRVRAHAIFKDSITFWPGDAIPPVGSRVYHCGSPAGQMNAASLTNGIISQIGRQIPDFVGSENGVYDQIDASALPGSSGGMIATQEKGEYIGMLTVGMVGSDNFHYFVPIRLIREWADEINVKWLLDVSVKCPTDDEIKKIPVESTPPGLLQNKAAMSMNGLRRMDSPNASDRSILIPEELLR